MPSSRSLRVLGARDAELGRDTIMDRALAAKHGVPYVHLAAFAIDVDRVRETAGDEDPRPFAWDVLLTEAYLIGTFDPQKPEHLSLVEDACLAVLDGAPGESPLGGQLPFAVHDAVRRGQWPAELSTVFRQWRSRQRGLEKDLDALFADPAQLRALARSCLETKLSPPAVLPTLEAWGRMVAGRFVRS